MVSSILQPRWSSFEQDGHQIQVLIGGSAQHEEAERELLGRGVCLPLPHRAVWAKHRPAAAFWFLLVREPSGKCAGGFMLEVNPSRALPWHLLLRVERFGASVPDAVVGQAIKALGTMARVDGRVLRLDIEVFSGEASRRQALGAAIAAAGMTRAPLSRSYSATLVCDLPASDEEHLVGLSVNTRRHVRAVNKHPVLLRPVKDYAFAARLDALTQETMQRTGGFYEHEDWRWKIALSQAAPEVSRLIGLFRAGAEGPESLLAFAWGCCHGDYAHYEASGSTRPADLKVSLSYALMWDLMCWARHNGAHWFDLGGVPEGQTASGDPTGGITDFKRHFSDNIQQVGERWILEPSALRSRLARGIGDFVKAARLFRS